MQTPAPHPLNEKERLAALAAWQILDTEPEQAFDDLAWLASQWCDTPIALVSLVDESRQWFKSRVGLTAQQTPRNIAFCAHAIHGSSTMVVADTLLDERFCDNPLVTSDPNIRFYAGAPLVDGDGYALGTLCVIDRKPREMKSEHLQVLELLSKQVVRLMELRRSNRELAESLQRTKCLAEMMPICSHCHAIRDQGDDWQRLERYFGDLTGAKFSHGICPACVVQHYSDVIEQIKPRT